MCYHSVSGYLLIGCLKGAPQHTWEKVGDPRIYPRLIVNFYEKIAQREKKRYIETAHSSSHPQYD